MSDRSDQLTIRVGKIAAEMDKEGDLDKLANAIAKVAGKSAGTLQADFGSEPKAPKKKTARKTKK